MLQSITPPSLKTPTSCRTSNSQPTRIYEGDAYSQLSHFVNNILTRIQFNSLRDTKNYLLIIVTYRKYLICFQKCIVEWTEPIVQGHFAIIDIHTFWHRGSLKTILQNSLNKPLENCIICLLNVLANFKTTYVLTYVA